MEDIQDTDVLVVGAGVAGIAAAVAAASKGLKVTLIERNGFPGGKATAAEVGTVCGLYEFSKSAESTYVAKGFMKEFADELQKRSETVPLHNNEGLHYLPYETSVFKSSCLQLLSDHKVETFFNSVLDKVNISNNSIGSVEVKTKDQQKKINTKTVVDCSGDAAISRATGLEIISSDHYQAAAQVFSLENVTEENEARLGMILMKALRSAIDEKKLPDHYDRVYIVQGSLKNNNVNLKLGIPVMVTFLEGNEEKIKAAASQFVSGLTDFLVNNVPAFKNAAIKHIAPEVGIRVGMRSSGKYILTEDDVLGCRKFNDAIANGSWPIEEWELHKRVKMRYFNHDDFYQVPAGCLQSKYIDNLFMAGRNISATTAAIASARVMGTCLQTGYAAGSMAAGKVLGIGEQDVINSIQTRQL